MRAVSPLLQRFPFAGILFAAIAGILLAEVCGGHALLLACIVLGSGCALVRIRHGGICWAATVGVFALLHWWCWSDSPARTLAERLDAVPVQFAVRGIVSGEPKVFPSGSAVFPLEVLEITRTDDPDFRLGIPVTVQVRWEGPRPTCGDEVVFSCRAGRAPPARNPGAMGYRRWLERKGIYTVLSVDPSLPGRILGSGKGYGLMATAIHCRNRMREILSTGLEGAPDVAAAISGICLGVTDGAPEGFLDEFRFTGTMHLFAVSGLHVGMIAVIFWFALSAFRVPRPWAVGLIIPALFSYVLVTGMKTGSVRSAVMSSLLLLGLAMLRKSPLLNTLAAAAFLQLALDTNTLFSPGWQFSYSVVAAIILLTPLIERRAVTLQSPDPFLPGRLLTRSERVRFATWRRFCGLAAVSVAAWIGSLVPTLVYFHLISLSALGANILAVPLAFAVLSLGVLALGTGIFSPWVAGAFNNSNWLVAKALLAVVQGSTLIPCGHWFVGPPGPPWPVLSILDLNGVPSTVIRSGTHFSRYALLDAGRRGQALPVILPCLESSGANSLDEVLVTRSDAARMGGLDVIGRQYRIRRLDIPSVEGRSPYARRKFPGIGEVVRPSSGDSIMMVPGCSARIIAPEKGDFLVPRLDLGCLRVLYLPPLTDPVLESLSSIDPVELRSDILVVPLGGASLAGTLNLLRCIHPKAVICPVLPFARGGMPSGEWDRILAAEGVEYLRMDRTGAVIIEADPKGPSLRTWLDQRSVPISRGSPGTP